MHRTISLGAVSLVLLFVVTHFAVMGFAQSFHGSPASAGQARNPYTGEAQAMAGKKLYAQNCSQCHGNNLQGMGPAPALASDSVKHASAGELFWFITNGDLNKGMPSWPQLTKEQRWQLVTFLESRNAAK